MHSTASVKFEVIAAAAQAVVNGLVHDFLGLDWKSEDLGSHATCCSFTSLLIAHAVAYSIKSIISFLFMREVLR